MISPFILSGIFPLNGEWTSGNGLLNPSGLYSLTKAGFGIDTLVYTYIDTITGCIFSDTKIITIHEPPTAIANIPFEGCKDELIEFNINPTGLESAVWSFGDGSFPAIGFNVNHIYQNIGDFTITLVVENSAECKDTLTQTIHITQPALPLFSLAPNIDCAPLSVTFINESQGEYSECFWNFDNGLTSNDCDSVTIVFEQGDSIINYFPSLTLTNLCDVNTIEDTVTVLPRPLPNFVISLDTICSGETVSFQNISLGDPISYKWIDGHGNMFDGFVLPPQQYFTDSTFSTYYFTLIATNDCGTDSIMFPLVVKPIDVKAFFNLDNNTFCQYEEIQIENGATVGSSVTYNFGDQNTSSEPNPTHAYQEPGLYKIVQYATTGCGFDSVFQWITVLPAPVFEMPNLPEVCVGEDLEFLSTNDTTLTTCIWSFGDGTTSSSCKPIHSYEISGDYTVTLTVTDIATQCVAKDSIIVTVRPSPIANAFTMDTVGCGMLTSFFQNANSTPQYTHIWNFHNGNSTDINPEWFFDTPGNYSITLQTTDNFGCVDDTTFNMIVTVHPVPNANFSLDISDNCKLPVIIQTNNQSTGIDTLGFEWTFSNGLQSNFTDTTIIIEIPNDYSIQLVAKNQFQCSDSSTIEFKIFPEILADFIILDTVLCAGDNIIIENQSENVNVYDWFFSNGDVASGELPNYSFQNSGTYYISLVATLDSICTDTSLSKKIEILPSPLAGFFVRDTFILNKPSGTIICQDTSQGAIEYFYDFGNGDSSIESNPMYRYLTIGEKTIKQIVTNQWECMDTAIVNYELPYFDGLYIPTALMPDVGGGEYTIFKPKGVNLKEFKIEVFSPKGERVWFSNELTNDGQPKEHWDGNNENGKPYPQGAYVWKVEARFENDKKWEGQSLKGEKIQIIGSVTIIR